MTWRHSRGFTLIELMMVILVISILAAIAVAKYGELVNKSKDAAVIGNLGVIRSALRVYYGELGGYPADDLTVLVTNRAYLAEIPALKLVVHPNQTTAVTVETAPSEVQTWSYNNDDSVGVYGNIAVGCLHTDTRGVIWSSY